MLTGNLVVVNIIFWTSNIFLLAESHVGKSLSLQSAKFLFKSLLEAWAKMDLNVDLNVVVSVWTCWCLRVLGENSAPSFPRPVWMLLFVPLHLNHLFDAWLEGLLMLFAPQIRIEFVLELGGWQEGAQRRGSVLEEQCAERLSHPESNRLHLEE